MHLIRVAINAKGGYCWHVYRKSVLVIDGNNRRWSRRREISGGRETVDVGSPILNTRQPLDHSKWKDRII
jgi:hypothetical protein